MFNLTSSQKRIYYSEALKDTKSTHNIGGEIRFSSNISIKQLEHAVHKLIQANDSLNLKFIEVNDDIKQLITKNDNYLVETIIFNNEIEMDQWKKVFFNKKFSIFSNEEPLFRFTIFKLKNDYCGVFCCLHHLIADGWSFKILYEQLCDFLLNKDLNVSSFNTSFLAYVEDEKKYYESNRFKKDETFWENECDTFKDIKKVRYANKLDSKVISRKLDSDMLSKINEIAKVNEVSFQSVLLSAYQILISKIEKNENNSILLPIFNRVNRHQRVTTGMFTSSTPFFFKNANNYNVFNLVKNTNQKILKLYKHQKFPYEKIIKMMPNMNGNNISKYSFNFHNVNLLKNNDMEVKEYFSEETYFPLECIIRKNSEMSEFEISFKFQEEFFEEITVENLLDHYLYIIKKMIDPQLQVNSILLKSSKVTNFTKKMPISNLTFKEIFEKNSLIFPDKIAIYCGDLKYNYRQLNERANEISNFLMYQMKVEPGSNITVIGNHSFELISTLIAVLKASCTFVPVDPELPIERINYFISETTSEVTINTDTKKVGVNFSEEVFSYEMCGSKINNKQLNNIIDDQSLAYILFTSGSTGKPKGVKISNKNLMNYISWANRTYVADTNDVFALHSSISFDLTITSIFSPLLSGASIAIYPISSEKYNLFEVIDDNIANLIKLTPSHLRAIKDYKPNTWIFKKIILGGEDLRSDLVQEIMINLKNSSEIVNEYGPTETTVGCTYHIANLDDFNKKSIPIGKPIQDTEIFILDDELETVPLGIEGEMYISGNSVSKGYLNSQDTKRSFVHINNNLLYKTGDLAIIDKNYVLHYKGRTDDQLKINGYRINLSEIENALRELKYVKESYLFLNDNKKSNVIGYVILNKEENNGIKEIDLLKDLKNKIPTYMIPHKLMIVDKFPVNANGKIDKSKIIINNNNNKIVIHNIKSRNNEIYDIISKVLDINEVSPQDNFFEIGGDSISAIQIASKLREIDYEISIPDFLEQKTIKDIEMKCKKISTQKNTSTKNRSGAFDGLPMYKWFEEYVDSDFPFWNQSLLIKLKVDYPIETLNKAMDLIVKRHDSLRVKVTKNDFDEYLYNIANNQPQFIFEELKLTYSEKRDIALEIKTHTENLRRSMKILNNDDVLIKGIKLRSSKESFLFLTAHHLAVDGLSWRVLIDELEDILLNRNDEYFMTDSIVTYSEQLTSYKNSKNFESEISFWNHHLNTLKQSPRSSLKTYGETIELERKLAQEKVKLIQKDGNKIFNKTFNEFLLSASTLAYSEIFVVNNIPVEIEKHGRNNLDGFNTDISKTIGWFTSIYPLVLKTSDQHLKQNLKELKEQQRKVPADGFNFQILKDKLEDDVLENFYPVIRFNYLGELNLKTNGIFEMSDINTGSDVGEKNKFSTDFEINSMITNNELVIKCRTIHSIELANKYMDTILKKLEEIIYFLSHQQEEILLTPSDFSNRTISQSDLDSLF